MTFVHSYHRLLSSEFIKSLSVLSISDFRVETKLQALMTSRLALVVAL